MMNHVGDAMGPGVLAQHALAGGFGDLLALALVSQIVADLIQHFFFCLETDDFLALLEEFSHAGHALQQLEDAACGQLKRAQI